MFDYLFESVIMSFALGGIVGALAALHLTSRRITAQENKTFAEDGIPVFTQPISKE